MALQEQRTPGPVKHVETKHAQYQARASQWRRCRDCYDGNDAVKAPQVDRLYLPPLDTHKAGVEGSARYEAYKTRALFYNALSRTVDGLAGAVFQKPPKVELPDDYEDDLKDVTLRGEPADLVALIAMREVLLTGRYGVLVDVTSGKDPRAYWTAYRAEDIVNWRVTRLDDDPAVTTMVVLREDDWVPEPTDPEFSIKKQNAYRVLRLTDGKYTTQRWTCKNSSGPSYKGGLEVYEPGEVITPTRRGQPLDFIPFTFFGPTSIVTDVAKPPSLDLADVNLSHYRTSADLEHGRHYVSLPTPWLAGASVDNGDVVLGPSGMLILDKGGVAGMLEFSGAGLGSLETADQEKRKMMAVLGARLLEDAGGPAETATAVSMRHAGEHATLRTIAAAIEQGFREVLTTHVWWSEGAGEYDAVEVAYDLNKDFFNVRMSSEDAKTMLLMLQAQAISFEEFWSAVTEGNYIVSSKTAKEVKAQIDREQPEPVAPAAGGLAPMPGVKPGPGGLAPAGGKPTPGGAAPAAGGVKVPPGTHLVRDAGAPGAPKANR